MHNKVLAYENGDEFMRFLHDAAEDRGDRQPRHHVAGNVRQLVEQRGALRGVQKNGKRRREERGAAVDVVQLAGWESRDENGRLDHESPLLF
jgi:hypothetical protein